jgi:excisionase family DNA binding protein
MADEYLNMQEASAYMNVTRRKIWRLIKQGELKSYENPMDRRECLVLKADVEELKKPRPSA